jgi:hypothetical protein
VSATIAVEVGPLAPAASGLIKGLRFWGADRTGGHVGHRNGRQQHLLGCHLRRRERHRLSRPTSPRRSPSPAARPTSRPTLPTGGYSATANTYSADGYPRASPLRLDYRRQRRYRYGDLGRAQRQPTTPTTASTSIHDAAGHDRPGRHRLFAGIDVSSGHLAWSPPFNEAIAPATVNFTLTGPSGVVGCSVYNAASKTATLTPNARATGSSSPPR